MRWPVDTVQITQGFRDNPYLFGYGAFGHTGVDLAVPIGTPVKAAVSGTVIGIGTDPNYVGGLFIIIRQDGGDQWECYTGHMSKIEVARGQHVGESDQIGLSGMTGSATGPHVHFQVRHFGAGDLVNPVDLITEGGDMYNGKTAQEWAQAADNATSIAELRAQYLAQVANAAGDNPDHPLTQDDVDKIVGYIDSLNKQAANKGTVLAPGSYIVK